MWIVKHVRAYGHYLMEYTAEQGRRIDLKWTWSLERKDAKVFDSKEAAEQWVEGCVGLKTEECVVVKA